MTTVDPLTKALDQVLTDWGFALTSDPPHSWRCQYPQFGECDHRERLIADLRATLVSALNDDAERRYHPVSGWTAAALRTALHTHGVHSPFCAWTLHGSPCDCGLAAALAESADPLRAKDLSAAGHSDTRSLCPRCGEWRDSPTADCAGCGWYGPETGALDTALDLLDRVGFAWHGKHSSATSWMLCADQFCKLIHATLASHEWDAAARVSRSDPVGLEGYWEKAYWRIRLQRALSRPAADPDTEPTA